MSTPAPGERVGLVRGTQTRNNCVGRNCKASHISVIPSRLDTSPLWIPIRVISREGFAALILVFMSSNEEVSHQDQETSGNEPRGRRCAGACEVRIGRNEDCGGRDTSKYRCLFRGS